MLHLVLLKYFLFIFKVVIPNDKHAYYLYNNRMKLFYVFMDDKYQSLIGKWELDTYTNLLCHINAYQQYFIFHKARSNIYYCTLTFLFAITHDAFFCFLIHKCGYLGENQWKN